MRLVGKAQRHAAIEEPVLAEARALSPTVLWTSAQASCAQVARPRSAASSIIFCMNMPRCAHCGGPKWRGIEKNRPTGAPNRSKFFANWREPRRPVLARDADRRIELLARGEAAAPPRLAQAPADRRRTRCPSPAGFAARLAATRAFSSASASPASTSTCQGWRLPPDGARAASVRISATVSARHRPVEKGPGRMARRHRFRHRHHRLSPLDLEPPYALTARK